MLTVHIVTFGVPHIKTGSLHIGRQHVPPFILITQHRLGTRRTHSAFCDTHNRKEPHLGTTMMLNPPCTSSIHAGVSICCCPEYVCIHALCYNR